MLPDPHLLEAGTDLACVGADWEPGTLLAAYRLGLFPMPIPMPDERDGQEAELGNRATGHEAIGWWSPDPRGVLPLDGLRVSRSLRRSCSRFEIRVNTAFGEVMEACADTRRPQGWITPDVRRAYQQLHRLEWAHSVEAWSLEDGRLAGGLYGVAIGGLFAGESMFHRATDASKVALVGLVELLKNRGYVLLDVQWATSHLQSLGVVNIARPDYLAQLHRALEVQPTPLLATASS